SGNKNLFMLPIPANDGVHTYQELKFSDNDIVSKTIKDYLNKSKKINFQSKCHADPNLVNYFNDPEFLGSIGQVDQAQSHLLKNEIKQGDLFIFFGVFAETYLDNDNLVVDKNSLKHIMFGYMQIGDIISTYGLNEIERANYESKYPWLRNQPHWIADKYNNNKTNCIYVASENFNNTNIKGYGLFNYDKELQLTQDNNNCVTHWNLPRELSNLKITYHSEKSHKEDYFKAACRGQEFVIENSKLAEIWAEKLIKKYANQ
ncbi:MAG: hypothetical protein J6J33_03780, partial [Clostridia bacterium]|nr:hypothetical protein [Clostridia bacterium]